MADAAKQVHQFKEVISCHAWNGARTEIALSPNNPEVRIFSLNGKKFEETAVLAEHFQRVTGVDWAPNSDCIVTCGADRNAYVWKREDGKWKPTLVILRINRAATCVRWSPKEDKFAVGSAARVISVCYFEKENDWWVSKHIKKPIRSTITTLDWHPNNILIGSGATDFKARVFSAYIKEIEAKPDATNWGKKMPFGNLMGEWTGVTGTGNATAWIHAVAFSADGSKMAWVAHDSSINVIEGGEGAVPITLLTDLLPFKALVWLGAGALLAAGHDCTPVAFSLAAGKLALQTKLDQAPAEEGEGKMTAMDRFRSMDTRGQDRDSSRAKAALTTHVNPINQIIVHTSSNGMVSKVATSAIDGRICVWDLKSLERSMAELSIK